MDALISAESGRRPAVAHGGPCNAVRFECSCEPPDHTARIAWRLVRATRSLFIDGAFCPASDGVQMGPVAKRGQFERVNRYIAAGIAEGATLLAGGVGEHATGWFVKPTIFADARNDMSIARDEIFGPVATVIPFGARLPWGVVGSSGIGRECGLSGVLAYTEEKAITVLLAGLGRLRPGAARRPPGR